MFYLIYITLLITPLISGHTYGIKTHVPIEQNNDVQSHYRVTYTSPLTTGSHTDGSQSSFSSYSKSYKTDNNGNVILSSSNGDFGNPEFHQGNKLNNDNLGTSTYTVRHESRRVGDNSDGYDSFVDNTLNKNVQEHQNILENIQKTYGSRGIYEGSISNSRSHGSDLGTSVSHQGSLGETISHQNSGSSGNLGSSVNHGNSGTFYPGLQSSVSHSDSQSRSYGTSGGKVTYEETLSNTQSHHGSNHGSNLGTSLTHQGSLGETLGSTINHQNSGSSINRGSLVNGVSSVNHGNTGPFYPNLQSSVSRQDSQGTSYGSSDFDNKNTYRPNQSFGSSSNNLGTSITHHNSQADSSNLRTSISHGNNNGFGSDINIHRQGSGTYGSLTPTHTSSNSYGKGFEQTILHKGSSSHGSNISYENNKQNGHLTHSASTGFGSGSSISQGNYNIDSSGLDLYDQHYNFVKSHKFSKCPPGITGQFAIPEDCHKFLNCWQGDGHVQDCGTGLVFDEKIRGCAFPSGNSYTC